MRIGVDVRPLMDRYYSGVSEYTQNLLSSLFELDRENQYVLYYNSFRDVRARIPFADGPGIRIRSSRYPNKIFNYCLQAAIARPRLDRLAGAGRFFMPHLNFAAVSKSAELVLAVHDLSFLRFPEFFSWRKNLWHLAVNARKLLRRADRIIAVSESTKGDIVDLANIEPAKIKVIHSGIGAEFRLSDRDSGAEKAVKEKYRLPDEYILNLNTVEPRKNIIGLIQAFARYCREKPEARASLVIAGARGWRYEGIFRYWQRSEYRDRIRFIGYVDRADKPHLYAMARLFVYPSFYEGFGFPPLEAMAAGCPVVAAGNSSLGEICAQAAVLVDANDAAAIAAAISEVAGDPALRETLAKKGRLRAAEFSWAKSAEEYRRVLAGS